MQFDRFEKRTSANYFKIEREKSYDYLFNNIPNKITEQVPVRKWRTPQVQVQVSRHQNKRIDRFLPNPID